MNVPIFVPVFVLGANYVISPSDHLRFRTEDDVQSFITSKDCERLCEMFNIQSEGFKEYVMINGRIQVEGVPLQGTFGGQEVQFVCIAGPFLQKYRRNANCCPNCGHRDMQQTPPESDADFLARWM